MAKGKKSKSKHTFSDYLRVYKKRFSKLDSKTKIQIGLIVILIILVLFLAVTAIMGIGKKPDSSSEITGSQSVVSGSYERSSIKKYEDEYLKLIKEYDDVVIAENDIEDKNYLRETLFVGDSNTEALAAYKHISLQCVLGLTGMPIQQVPTNKCIWFAGYSEPVTMPQAIGLLKPRRIIINFGTNNAGGTETEDFIKYYNSVLNTIEKAYPYADIIVSAVLPVGEKRSYPSITREDIDDFNLALAEMCREREIKFLNTAEMFKNPENGYIKDKYISKDGIHLTGDGYRAFLEYVETHKHIVPDKRPARGSIPTIVTPPEPTQEPSPSPSISPSPSVSPSPTPTVTPAPSPTRTPEVTVKPEVTVAPTPQPTAEVTPIPTPEVTAEPTRAPTPRPTATPTAVPTQEPTPVPIVEPTRTPTLEPEQQRTPEV